MAALQGHAAAGLGAAAMRGTAIVLGPLLLTALAGLVRFAMESGKHRIALPAGHAADPFTVPMAALALCMVAVDSALAKAGFSELLDLAAARPGGDAATLYLARPVAGVTAMVLVPLVLRAGPRCGRLVVAAGLLTQAFAYLLPAVLPSFLAAMVASSLRGGASGAIFTAALHTLLVQEARTQISSRGHVLLCSLAVACSCGPRVVSALVTLLGLPAVLAVLSCVAAAACCLYLAISTLALQLSPDRRAGLALTWEPAASLFEAASETLCDRRRRLLLVGVGLSAAALSLHALLPSEKAAAAGGGAEFAWLEGAEGMALGLWLLACARSARANGESWGIRGLLVALTMTMLGFRAVMQGQSSKLQFMVCIGSLSSHSGIGGYLGIALPLLLERWSTCGAFRTAAAAAVACSALGVAWQLGDALGVAAQVVLYPLLGAQGTVSALVAALGAHAAAVLAMPGWRPSLEKDVMAGFACKPPL